MKTSPNDKIRVALVGCGKIADAHLQEIRKIPCAELVAVCDVHQDLADQAAARYEVPRAFDDLQRLLSETSPDVVHLTTPAQTHCALATELLRAGVHIYVEKPFTADVLEAESVLEVAHEVGRSVCLGHDQLFDPSWLQCREMVQEGAIGDVTHVETVLGYSLSGQFGRRVATDASHWVRKLPGGLFQNTISHSLYRITDFLTDERPVLNAHWFSGSSNASFPTELVAHLRGEHVTGNLLFSSRIETQRITWVYGTAGVLEVNPDAQVVRRSRQNRMPGAFEKLEIPWKQCREAAGNLRRNAWRFLKSDIHYFAGMRRLFEDFYGSILSGSPPPIAYEEMLRVTRIMDELFQQCREREQVTGTTASTIGPGGKTAKVANGETVKGSNGTPPHRARGRSEDDSDQRNFATDRNGSHELQEACS